MPQGLKEAVSGVGQLGTAAARALAPGTANVIGNVAGAARGIEGAIDVGNAIAGAPGESTGQRVLQGVGGAVNLAGNIPKIANVIDAAVGTNLGTSAGGALAPGTSAGEAAAIVGKVAPVVAGGLNIAPDAMSNEPDWEKAADSAVDAAAIVLAFTPAAPAALFAPAVKVLIGELSGRPSEAWASFPSQVGTDWKAREGAMGTLAKNVQAAQSPEEGSRPPSRPTGSPS